MVDARASVHCPPLLMRTLRVHAVREPVEQGCAAGAARAARALLVGRARSRPVTRRTLAGTSRL